MIQTLRDAVTAVEEAIGERVDLTESPLGSDLDWSDWQNHVPYVVAANWWVLDDNERAIAFLTAFQVTVYKPMDMSGGRDGS